MPCLPPAGRRPAAAPACRPAPRRSRPAAGAAAALSQNRFILPISRARTGRATSSCAGSRADPRRRDPRSGEGAAGGAGARRPAPGRPGAPPRRWPAAELAIRQRRPAAAERPGQRLQVAVRGLLQRQEGPRAHRATAGSRNPAARSAKRAADIQPAPAPRPRDRQPQIRQQPERQVSSRRFNPPSATDLADRGYRAAARGTGRCRPPPTSECAAQATQREVPARTSRGNAAGAGRPAPGRAASLAALTCPAARATPRCPARCRPRRAGPRPWPRRSM